MNSKSQLAAKGAEIKSSSRRKRLCTKFQQFTENSSYVYPPSYEEFRSQQRKARLAGVSLGQKLFEKYLPKEAVELLKREKVWDEPYTFKHPNKTEIAGDTNMISLNSLLQIKVYTMIWIKSAN